MKGARSSNSGELYCLSDLKNLRLNLLVEKKKNKVKTLVFDPNIRVQRTLMYYLLEKRSKTLLGFPKGKFYLEFSSVFYVCTMVQGLGVNVKNHESFFEKETKEKMEFKVWNTLT